MTSEISTNGNHPKAGDPEPVNAYADAVSGSQPREIAQFELNTDPYANMVPRVSAMTSVERAEEGGESRSRHPVIVAVSVGLIVVLVLPIMAEVFARLIH